MTYELLNGADGAPAIKCLRCGLLSYHPQDIKHLYCNNCHQFHSQEIAPGVTLRADVPQMRSQFHRAIVQLTRVPNTKTGNYADLECGHRVMTFGNIDRTEGRVFCEQCEAGR